MVQDDLGVRKGAGQVDQVVELGLQLPGVKGQAQGRKLGETFAEPGIPVETCRPASQGAQHRRIRV